MKDETEFSFNKYWEYPSPYIGMNAELARVIHAFNRIFRQVLVVIN
jgi:hypothetical protein